MTLIHSSTFAKTKLFDLRIRLAFILLLTACFTGMNAQPVLQSVRNSDAGILINASYGPQVTIGDLSERFGNPWSIELGVDYLTKADSWQIGLVGQLIFGSDVKVDVLEALRTSSGFIVGNQRDPADIQLRMRAIFLGVRVGKTISLGGDNPRSGLKLGLGGGWLTHQIRIQNDPVQTVNQLVGEYRAGYDRLTAGPALYQFIGYQQLSINGRLNFYIGAEFIEGFTQSQRDFDFATGGSLDDNRLDILAGFRAGIILPLYQGEGREIFYR